MITEQASGAATLDALHAEMGALQLEGLWRLGDEVQAAEPRVVARPYVWRGADVRRVLERAGTLVQHDAAAERRTIRLVNPGLGAQHCATHTLAASVQLIRPGEVAPTHRHTPAAIRFIIQGHGAYTTINGERCTMEPGDLVLTPRWSWHHHGNAGDEPVMWMDGLDFPLVILLNGVFFERYPAERQPETRPADTSERQYGSALRPVRPNPPAPFPTREGGADADSAAAIPSSPRFPRREGGPGGLGPLLTYRWADTYAALQRLAAVDASPYDDVALEYTDPRTGGHTLPALACWVQMLRPGVRTRAHRHTASAVYQVFRGRGYSVIAGERLNWQRGDFVALPTWAWHEHANTGDEEVVLFSITDLPVMEALDLYREESYPEGNGHQPVA
ncbi:MAG TPA: cupin domain-containing protein [Chloroflexota bacterium]|jgi:gentisate 1,2-dioxygenase